MWKRLPTLLAKDLKLKIIEVDKQKKRIVASRKAVMAEEAAAKKKEAWDKLQEGEIIHGIVRRLTDFGAFVDVGGVDGLVHITDLSWGRIKHPSEVVQPNQEIDVKVLGLDRERERIQLGYKQLQPRPWDNATEKYPEGSVVEGKVVRITDFGAFVELEPGLDGLVHISQCALTRVAKVEDAVQVGQTVRVKVLSVDPEKKRISLSIRQVLEDEAFNYETEIPGDAEFEIVAGDDMPADRPRRRMLLRRSKRIESQGGRPRLASFSIEQTKEESGMPRCIIILPLYAGEAPEQVHKAPGDLLLCADGGYERAPGLWPGARWGDW